ncbi:SsrA-binding protein SmpB [bacterium]|nr:SsrA-binding protein SmpB [bacterium]
MKSKVQASDQETKLIAENRKAFHDYFILEKLEVGIALVGSELRPCREGRVVLKDSFADERDGELWLHDVHIGQNQFSNILNHDPLRTRRLLAHKRQILKIRQKVTNVGISLVPLRIYFRKGRVKIELALVKGKRQYDKRETIAKKDLKREMEREFNKRG